MERDNFSVIVRNQYGKVRYIIEKDNMITDSDGGYYFVLAAVKRGLYYATLMAEREDTDFASGVQHLVDIRPPCQ